MAGQGVICFLSVWLIFAFATFSQETQGFFGSLLVKTDNNLKIPVWVNGKRMGATPVSLAKFPAGEVSFGFLAPKVASAILEKKLDPKKNPELVKLIGQTDHPEFQKIADALALASQRTETLSPGAHLVVVFPIQKTVSSFGPKQKIQTIATPDGEEDVFFGRLLVRADNGDTVPVWIDGKRAGRTPLVIEKMPVGNHEVSFLPPAKRDSIFSQDYPNLDLSDIRDIVTLDTLDAQQKLAYEYSRISRRSVFVKKDADVKVVFGIGEMLTYVTTQKKQTNFRYLYTSIILIGVVAVWFVFGAVG